MARETGRLPKPSYAEDKPVPYPQSLATLSEKGYLRLSPKSKSMVAANQKPGPLGSANATMLAPEGAPFDFPPPATITTN